MFIAGIVLDVLGALAIAAAYMPGVINYSERDTARYVGIGLIVLGGVLIAVGPGSLRGEAAVR